MRNLRVNNLSMKTLAINLLAWSALSAPALAQSFDYPAGSSSLLNRGQNNRGQNTARDNVENFVPSARTAGFTKSPSPTLQPNHRQSFQGVNVQQNNNKPSMLSKLFSRRSKTSKPVFASPYLPASNTNVPASRQAYDTQSSVYISPAQTNPSNHVVRQASDPLGNVKGYQPVHGDSEIQRVNFDQYSNQGLKSILEAANHGTGQPAVDATTASLSGGEFAATPVNTSVATPASKALTTTKTAALDTPPAAKVAQRIALPRDAFKEEFDKAYKYINPNAKSPKRSGARIAQSQDRTRELQFEDFAPAQSRQSFENDFSTEDQSMIAPPEFIAPQASEQSPNANAPAFNPPSFDRRIDTLPTTPGSEPEGTLSQEVADSALPEAANSTGDFADDFGSIDEWEPPKPSTKGPQRSLEEELADISKPFLLSPGGDNASNNATLNNDADANAAFANNFPTSQESPVWWKQLVTQPLYPENQSVPVDTNGLVYAAIQGSPRIQAVSQNPLIRELQVVEADAEFDPVRFVRSQFEDRVDPVGNILDVGAASNAQFLKRNIWTAEAGVNRKYRTGADVNVSQQLGFQNSNSLNFTPQDQGTATLALNVTQPLLRGRGRYYNQAQILIAQSTGGVAWEVFQKDLQEELEGVVAAYWQLYLNRSVYLQRKRNVERGQVILDRLNGRRELDSLPAQISRARSSVLTRRTELANAFRNVRNAETEIRRRVADRNWMASQALELLPAELPTIANVGWELDQVVQTALSHRPEIRESMQRIKISGIQRDVSENELLPELSFLFGTYVSALQGESDVFGAFTDQFGEVTPGYSFGIEYELPRRNRAARSRFQQRHLQFKRLQAELEEVIQNVIAESQISLRRINSAIETLSAAEQAILAARADLQQNETRWESFALVEGDIAEGVTPTTVLDQLLDSQERLAQTEIVYAQAEQELKVAEIALQRSMGTLLMQQQVSYDRQVISDTPSVNLQKQPTPSQSDSGPVYGEPIYSEEVYNQQQPFPIE